MLTAILLKYKRPIDKVLDSLNNCSLINQVIVVDNLVDNNIAYGRYVRIDEAKNDLIYFQDDDCIVDNIDELYKLFDGRITNNIVPSHEHRYKGTETIVGWGAIIHRDMVSVLDKYIDVYGKDFILKREADRIFSVLLNQKPNTLIRQIKLLDTSFDEHALWKQSEHEECRQLAVRRANEIVLSTT